MVSLDGGGGHRAAIELLDPATQVRFPALQFFQEKMVDVAEVDQADCLKREF